MGKLKWVDELAEALLFITCPPAVLRSSAEIEAIKAKRTAQIAAQGLKYDGGKARLGGNDKRFFKTTVVSF